MGIRKRNNVAVRPHRRCMAALALPWLFSLWLPGVASAAPARKTLTGAEIQQTFAGKVVTDGYHWSYHLKPDGSIEATEMGRSRKGHWVIRGNQLCINITVGASPDHCWGVVREGQALVFQINGNDFLDVMVKDPRH